jgi:uncharacterized membrane protein YccC
MALEDTLTKLNDTLEQQNRTDQQLAQAVIALVERSERNQRDAQQVAALTTRASEQFAEAATRTQNNVSELGHLIQLMERQLDQQNKSLSLQNEAIQTEIRLARESSRAGWIQNGIFFFLGILIPVAVQFVFRYF